VSTNQLSMKTPIRVVQKPHSFRGSRLVLLGAACALPVLAGEYRYPERPWGIVGDDKARDRAGFVYSEALLQKGGTWTEEDLDEFLDNASHFAPGSNKSICVADAEERREIIDFLKTELVD